MPTCKLPSIRCIIGRRPDSPGPAPICLLCSAPHTADGQQACIHTGPIPCLPRPVNIPVFAPPERTHFSHQDAPGSFGPPGRRVGRSGSPPPPARAQGPVPVPRGIPRPLPTHAFAAGMLTRAADVVHCRQGTIVERTYIYLLAHLTEDALLLLAQFVHMALLHQLRGILQGQSADRPRAGPATW
jgi:hypothetical protein